MNGDNLNKNIEKCTEFNEILSDILSNETVKQMHNYIQHGEISCYTHCYYVAYYTYLICKKLKLDYKSAVRGAMLHDLFLYDWHTTSPADINEKGVHAWAHPRIALKNASKIFTLNDTEKDIDVVPEITPGTLQRRSDGIIKEQHDNRENIQTARRYQQPAYQSPHLTMKNDHVRIQSHIPQG